MRVTTILATILGQSLARPGSGSLEATYSRDRDDGGGPSPVEGGESGILGDVQPHPEHEEGHGACEWKSGVLDALLDERPDLKCETKLTYACQDIVRRMAEDGTVHRIGRSHAKYDTITDYGYHYTFAAVFLSKTSRSDGDVLSKLLFRKGSRSEANFRSRDVRAAGGWREGKYVCLIVASGHEHQDGSESDDHDQQREQHYPLTVYTQPYTGPESEPYHLDPSDPTPPHDTNSSSYRTDIEPIRVYHPTTTTSTSSSYHETYTPHMTSVTRTNSHTSTTTSINLSSIQEVNHYRSSQSPPPPPLSTGPTCKALCNEILNLMIIYNVFDHSVANSNLTKRCAARHAGACAENIAKGTYHGAVDVNDKWYKSPGHRRNMLNGSVKYVATCTNGYYYAQVFTSNY